MHKRQNNKKLALNSQLQTYQILKNDDQIVILRLSYFITTVFQTFFETFWWYQIYVLNLGFAVE